MLRLALSTLLLVVASPAGADWLVLKNGTRIETRGAWTEKGRQIVYTTLAEKRLVSIRAADVDLEASRRASATEAAVGIPTFADLGDAPDANHLPPPPKPDLLGAWIKNPNAPRVSGTLSAPNLRVSLADLIREGEQILADPDGAVNALAVEEEQNRERYQDCVRVNGSSDSRCEADYRASDEALREKAWTAVAAVEAVRVSRDREAEAEAAEAAESKRIEDVRVREQEEARAAAEAEKKAQEKAAKEAARAEKKAEEGAPPPC